MTDTVMEFKLPASLVAAAREMAVAEGIGVTQFVSAAIAEKLSALEGAYLAKRAARGDTAVDVLARARAGNPPREGDELPDTAP